MSETMESIATQESLEEGPIMQESLEETPVVQMPLEEVPLMKESLEERPAVQEPLEETQIIQEPLEQAPITQEHFEAAPLTHEPFGQALVTQEHLEEASFVSPISKLPERIEELNVSVDCLIKRSDQFNDVKQSIKQMNDIIKKDLEMDFGALAMRLKFKMDEISCVIKEFLKDSYTDVRDTHAKINDKINKTKQLREEIAQMKISHKADDLILVQVNELSDLIDSINQELSAICDPSAQQGITAASLCSKNSIYQGHALYPEFSYIIETSKLIEEIQLLEVHINHSNYLSPDKLFGEKGVLFDSTYGSVFYCSITSSLSSEGIFWVKFICPVKEDMDDKKLNDGVEKCNLFIEEISKYIRCKRIGDKNWRTYAEAARTPQENEKCFCLEPKTKKWLRARITSYDKTNTSCQLRFLDTGSQDLSSYNLDSLLEWREIDLKECPALAVKCALFKAENEFESKICLETKFKFRDSTAGTIFKCEFVSPATDENLNIPDQEDPTWIVRLYEVDQELALDDNSAFNKMIIEFNQNEMNAANSGGTMSCRSKDIRLESGEVKGQSVMIKTRPDYEDEDSIVQNTVSLNPQSNLNQEDIQNEQNVFTQSHSLPLFSKEPTPEESIGVTQASSKFFANIGRSNSYLFFSNLFFF